nr:hypothetical protein [Tanacetum cinerariifolium]
MPILSGPRFTKVIIDYFMTRKPSIPRQNRVNWHCVKDDVLFTTIKVVSRHQTTQKYSAILPIELTTDDIRNNKAYKEYYACAIGEAAPKPKASARKKKGGSASSTTPPTPIATPTPTTTVVAAPRLSAATKDKRCTFLSNVISVDDEDVDEQTKGRDESEGDKTDESDNDDDDQDEAEKVNDDDDDEEEITKIAKQEVTESDEGNDEATESDKEIEAYDADKTILDTYGESTILKQIREDDDQEGPSGGSDRGSKRQREGGEHASAST